MGIGGFVFVSVCLCLLSLSFSLFLSLSVSVFVSRLSLSLSLSFSLSLFLTHTLTFSFSILQVFWDLWHFSSFAETAMLLLGSEFIFCTYVHTYYVYLFVVMTVYTCRSIPREDLKEIIDLLESDVMIPIGNTKSI